MFRFVSRTFWIGVGAVLAYLFDPVSGRSRRARLSDQAAARARDLFEAAGKEARYRAGKAKGVVHEIISSEEAPESDEDLLQKIRSEALGPAPGSLGHVDIEVEDGEVCLTGTSKDPSAEEDLAHRIRRVTGVRSVTNDLKATRVS